MNPECYQSKAFAAVEKKRVWGRSWVAVGNVDDLRSPGDTIIAEVGGQNIFVTRDKKGNLNGFYNVCRHRGSKLVLKNGRYPVISCP
jgi:choline monooxygenase